MANQTAKPAGPNSAKPQIKAAYFIAQQRGFGSGCELEDWLLAEKQIDAVLAS